MVTSVENTAAQAPLIRVEQLGVEFGSHAVLRGIDLAIGRGETLAIIGESGCGKTVLLKTLIGLVQPTRGTVFFDEQDLAHLNERTLTRQRIRFGFVFQQAALFDSMTIAQNVAFPLRQHTRKTAAEIDEIVAARLGEVGLPPTVRFKKPGELSGGMRKRVGLARALALEPEVVLYDEPTTGLDPIMSDVINELILGTPTAPRDERAGDARHELGAEGRRPGRDAVSPGAAEGRRGAGHLRRPARRYGKNPRPPSDAVHPRRGGRAVNGNPAERHLRNAEAMNERIMQFRVGVMILAAILIAAILVLLFKGSSLMQGTYPIYIKFSEAPGVSRDTPVRMDGIRIGRVQEVQFANRERGVIVTAEIDRNRTLYSDDQCRATYSLLMGDAALEFVRVADVAGNPVPIEPGTTLQGQSPPNLTGSLAGMQRQAAETLETLNTAGHDIDRLANRVDHLVETNEKRIGDMIGEAHETIQLLQQALRASNDILGDPQLRAQIKQTIAEMPVVLKDTQATIQQIGSTFSSLDKNMQNLEDLTRALGEHGPGVVAQFDASMKKLDQLSDNLLQFSRLLNSSQGSLGALLRDKDLYQHVDHLAKNLDDLSRDLKPIVHNVWIFTDKIARHPGDLGVRGALKKDSGLKDNDSGDETQPVTTNRWPLTGGGQWNIGGQ